MVIEYIKKEITEIKTDIIESKVIRYYTTEEALKRLAMLQTKNEEYKVMRIGLKDINSNICDLVIDNIEDGRILQGGKVEDNYILEYFIVKKGINELLFQLSL